MPVNTALLSQKIEQIEKRQAELRAERIATLVKILQDDPTLAEVVKQAIAELEISARPLVLEFAPPDGFKSGNGIQKAIVALNLPARFTSEDIRFRLEAVNFPFSAKDHSGAIRDALLKLSRGGDAPFIVIEKGAGGKPHIYARRAPESLEKPAQGGLL
jgi:hypothetical protein